jgi:hypothetical protein
MQWLQDAGYPCCSAESLCFGSSLSLLLARSLAGTRRARQRTEGRSATTRTGHQITTTYRGAASGRWPPRAR